MKKLTLLIASAFTSVALAGEPAQPQQQAEPTNEEIIQYLEKINDLKDKVNRIDLHFTIHKGEASDEVWAQAIHETAEYIIACLKDDDSAETNFVPFVQARVAQLKQEKDLHGNITVDFGNNQEEGTSEDQN